MTFSHVLVPVDLSDRSRRPLEAALAVAAPARARVTLLHVVERIPRIPAGELRAFYGRLRQASRRKLERATRPFVAAGLRVRVDVRLGSPPLEICRVAFRQKVDLIVMGSHRVDPRRPAPGFGTTSYKVGLACPCPVLLVK